MGKGRTTITQPFEIKIDVSAFLDVLQNKLRDAISASDDNLSDVFLEDWELDGEYIEFKGSYRTGAETWYYKQTLEEPEDSGYEPDTSLSKRDIEISFKEQMERFVDVKMTDAITAKLRNPIADLLRVAVVDDDYGPEFPDDDYDDGPDPDRAYDEWRDRQYEED